MQRTLIIVLVLVSFIGLVDASYLTAQHYSGAEVVCSIGEHQLGNCDSVLTSKYATLFGVPNALIGALYYFAALILSSLLFSFNNRNILKLLVLLTSLGLLASAWFVYLMLFVLKAICVYCLVSALATTALFLTSYYTLKRFRSPAIG